MTIIILLIIINITVGSCVKRFMFIFRVARWSFHLKVGEFLGKLYASHLTELKYSCHGDQSAKDTWLVTWIEPVLNCLITASEVHSTLITEVCC